MFNYLKSLLEGTVASAISGLTLTNDNHDHAVELLKARFGDRQVVISSHMESLTKLPGISNSNDVKGFRKLYDTVEAHMRSLESLEISSEMYGCFLTPIIMQMLPEDFRITVSRGLSSEPWSFKDILKNSLIIHEDN